MKNDNGSNWAIKNEYKAKLTLEDSKFIFDQAEKAFNDTIETSKKILDRSSTLLTIVSGLLVGLVAYSIKKWETKPAFDNLLITSIVAMAYFFVLGLTYIFPNIKPKQYSLPGTQPKKYFVDELFNVPPPALGRILFLYIIEIKNLQEAITDNRAVNEKKWSCYQRALNLVFVSPLVIVMCYFLLYFIRN